MAELMSNYFTIQNSRYNTRRNGIDINLPKISLAVAKKCFFYNGAHIFFLNLFSYLKRTIKK